MGLLHKSATIRTSQTNILPFALAPCGAAVCRWTRWRSQPGARRPAVAGAGPAARRACTSSSLLHPPALARAAAAAGGAEVGVGVWRSAGDASRPCARRRFGVSLSPRPVRRGPCFVSGCAVCARRGHDGWLVGRPAPLGAFGAGQDPTRISPLGRVASSLQSWHITHSFDASATTPFGLLGRRPVVPPHHKDR